MHSHQSIDLSPPLKDSINTLALSIQFEIHLLISRSSKWQENPRVRTISYGGAFTLKAASDLSMDGATDNDVIVYKTATNSFVIQPVSTPIVERVDGGEY